MALRIYNTMSQTKEVFEPLVEGKVGMYVCGVTVYDMCHIGHARAYVAFDVISRYLRFLDYDVTYVRNFTDVDDKIIARSGERGQTTRELTDGFIQEFYRDMAALNVQPVEVEPRVSEHIPQIISTIEKILANGHGYAVEDEVFFSIDSFPTYARLSRRKVDDMVAGASERVGVDSRKKNPLDFVLWKGSKPGEPSWPSPWGEGRPGWHIECSAMSAHHLGETFDIHGGGKDLIFPHHDNEIAQSEAAHGKPSVRYWMHNGFVNVAAEKMSKSLGNFVTIRKATELYHPQALRYFLLTTHYRSPINFSEDNLKEATARIEYAYETLAKIDQWVAAGPSASAIDEVVRSEFVEGVGTAFREAMDDDFNSAKALGLLSPMLSFANEVADGRKKATKKRRYATLKRIREVMTPLFEVLGLLDGDPREVLDGIRDRKLQSIDVTKERIEELIAERVAARQAKDFERSDAIRVELEGHGVILMDSPAGTTWKIG